MINIDLLVKERIENMTQNEMEIARNYYEEELVYQETDLKFTVWLEDYVYSYLFESGEE